MIRDFLVYSVADARNRLRNAIHHHRQAYHAMPISASETRAHQPCDHLFHHHLTTQCLNLGCHVTGVQIKMLIDCGAIVRMPVRELTANP